MRLRGCIAAMCAVWCLNLGVPSRATADEWNQETVFTFSHDMEIPGKVLPAGTYTFRLADRLPNRHMVLVFDHTGRMFAIALTIPATRFSRTGDTLITYDEQASGAPLLLKQWFYPGRLTGEEFVYPSHSK